MNKEHTTTVIAVVITVLVTWVVTNYLTQIEVGQNAQVLQVKMENGKTLGENLSALADADQKAAIERATILTNQGHILEAVRELSSE